MTETTNKNCSVLHKRVRLKKGPLLALFIRMLMEMAGLKTVDVNNGQLYCF